MYQHLTYRKVHFLIAVALLPIALLLIFNSSITLAGVQVVDRYDQLSNSNSGQVSNHNIGFIYANTTTPVGSVTIQFCANSPLISVACQFPTGMNISGATLSAQTGNTGFTIASIANGQILLTRNPLLPTSTASTYTFANIINPTSPGEYFGRILTYSSTDGSGPYIEQGGVTFAITSVFTVTSIVPPYLTFCGGVVVENLNCGDVVGNEINFGNFSPNTTSDATSQFVVATNAAHGYSVSVNGNTMTSGNYVIQNLTKPTKSYVGSSQFGINIVKNSNPSVGIDPVGNGIGEPTLAYANPNYYTFNDGDTVVSSTLPSDYNEFTATYLVNVSSDQSEGVYATTLYYICLANF
jgi:hypothetical protein